MKLAKLRDMIQRVSDLIVSASARRSPEYWAEGLDQLDNRSESQADGLTSASETRIPESDDEHGDSE